MTTRSSSCLRVFVAIDAAVYPAAAERMREPRRFIVVSKAARLSLLENVPQRKLHAPFVARRRDLAEVRVGLIAGRVEDRARVDFVERQRVEQIVDLPA